MDRFECCFLCEEKLWPALEIMMAGDGFVKKVVKNEIGIHGDLLSE